jgi:cysteine desulfurase
MDVTYLDNNATTRPSPEVIAAMMPYFEEFYGNPSSIHRFGQRARQAIDEARGHVAQLIGCMESEIAFTGGGTESVNTLIRGIFNSRSPRNKIITSTIEHSATRELCSQMSREGCEIIQIDVDHEGRLDLNLLAAALGDDIAMVSIMWANNETGVILQIPEISELCRNYRVPLHTDATQAVGKIAVNVTDAKLDAMSFAAHKFHGPKGVAGMFIRRGLRIRPLLVGGPQERNRRGGTENVPGIVGMGKAAEQAIQSLRLMPRVAALRDRLEQGILKSITETYVNGSIEHRLPNTTNIGFARLEAEAILILLSEIGICASAGAACSSGSLEPSPILKAMKIDPKIAHGSVRFSLSRYTTDSEIDFTLRSLPAIIDRLRRVLPVGEMNTPVA